VLFSADIAAAAPGSGAGQPGVHGFRYLCDISIMKKISKQTTLTIAPGQQAFELWLIKHSAMFNLSELERICDLVPGSLRYIRATKRLSEESRLELYNKFKLAILPNLCELVFICQNYPPY
jgi:hypothetical protein